MAVVWSLSWPPVYFLDGSLCHLPLARPSPIPVGKCKEWLSAHALVPRDCKQRYSQNMTDSTQLGQRITELEIKLSFQEDLLDKLDQIVIRHQTHIDALTRELIDLRQQSRQAGDVPQRNLRDDLPPHY